MRKEQKKEGRKKLKYSNFKNENLTGNQQEDRDSLQDIS